MPHLAKIRKGWEKENLARFILSKFSFVAQPVSVGDDIGADFFCTLFELYQDKKEKFLKPGNSFAIQIKSTTRKFRAKHIDFLTNLAIPFFVGVVASKNCKLTLYSGEYIPILFTEKRIEKLYIIPFEKRIDMGEKYYEINEKEENSYLLKFPKFMEIKAYLNRNDLNNQVQKISKLSFMMQENISSKEKHENIYNLPTYLKYHMKIIASKDSVETFRKNFLDRLTEAYYNLKWIYENDRSKFNEKEFAILKEIFYKLWELDLYKDILPNHICTTIIQSLNSLIEEDKKIV